MGVKEILIERAINKGAQLERAKAEEKAQTVVGNLIVKLDLSDEQAAVIADVSLDFVKKVRSGLKVVMTIEK